jgi:hypothetical protein
MNILNMFNITGIICNILTLLWLSYQFVINPISYVGLYNIAFAMLSSYNIIIFHGYYIKERERQ